ncbi:MAG: Gfo/Idh/MocA family oxidoreductase [Candidatus Binatia bacterium]|nr:Gfo/Idh/MocA family oxidoreductase [Candidatus Binatia bacterium]
MSPAVKIGLIGCGRIAQLVHLDVLRRLPGAELVALADVDPRRRREASRRVPGTAAFADYHELLARPEVEAVVICLPHALHAEAAIAALQQGKHVYLEKPLATNLDDARRVLSAWRDTGVVGMIGFNYRFNALYQTVKQYIQEGKLGELVSVRSVFSAAPRALPAWKQQRQSGGGALLDLALHHIDLVRFVFEQEVCEVFAQLRSQRSEDDSAVLHLRLVDGLLVQSFFSLSAIEEDRFELYGTAGKLAVDRHRSFNVEITDPACAHRARLGRLGRRMWAALRGPYLWDKLLAPRREPSYRAALLQFVTAVRTNLAVRPNFQDGYRSLAVVAAAEQSARTGRMVALTGLGEEDSGGRAQTVRA